MPLGNFCLKAYNEFLCIFLNIRNIKIHLKKSWNKNKNFSLCIHNFYTSNDHQYTKFVMISELMRTDCMYSITKEAKVLKMTIRSKVLNLSWN
jgi:hypothetical protein